MINLRPKNIIIHNPTESVSPIIGRVTRNPNLPTSVRDNYIFLSSDDGDLPTGFSSYLINQNHESHVNLKNIIPISKEYSYIDEGDIIKINTHDHSIRVIYRASSPHNFFLVTEQCNSYCLMCSQPPRAVDDSFLIEEIISAIPLIDRGANEIGITGGEPTLLKDRFLQLLRQLNNHLPDTSIHVLTNGRNFENELLAQDLYHICHKDLMLGIPLYSDLPNIHNYIVQAQNAYDQTIRGILNLKKYFQKVEIRIVVLKQNHDRLPDLARFITRNLTFVDQVVIMGLESTGFAKSNHNAVWIDPIEYQNQLLSAVKILTQSNIITKIYNHQLCVLPREIHQFSTKSISDWKNYYLDICDKCDAKQACGGFFETSKYISSHHIHPITLNSHAS